jgi:hypothetical protein|tara:strand:- start:54 stop:206 length:153 start_codon:yes stop_codon:yes gene_type:complete
MCYALTPFILLLTQSGSAAPATQLARRDLDLVATMTAQDKDPETVRIGNL